MTTTKQPLKTVKTIKPETKIALAFYSVLPAHIQFCPTWEFYNKIGIGRKRFGQIFRGEKPALVDELKAIAAYTNTKVEDLI